MNAGTTMPCLATSAALGGNGTTGHKNVCDRAQGVHGTVEVPYLQGIVAVYVLWQVPGQLFVCCRLILCCVAARREPSNRRQHVWQSTWPCFLPTCVDTYVLLHHRVHKHVEAAIVRKKRLVHVASVKRHGFLSSSEEAIQ